MRTTKGIPLPFCEVEGCVRTCRNHTCKMCSIHYEQIRRRGKIFTRTQNDPNEIEILETHALLHLYDRNFELKAKTLIDLDDIEKVSKYKWSVSQYVTTGVPTLFLHKFVMNSELEHDHINRNILDNRKHNLRPCTHNMNLGNIKVNRTNNTSGAKGVSWSKREKKYVVKIMKNKKSFSLGQFDSLVDAAQSYNKAALEYFGEFANINDIEALKASGRDLYNRELK